MNNQRLAHKSNYSCRVICALGQTFARNATYRLGPYFGRLIHTLDERLYFCLAQKLLKWTMTCFAVAVEFFRRAVQLKSGISSAEPARSTTKSSCSQTRNMAPAWSRPCTRNTRFPQCIYSTHKSRPIEQCTAYSVSGIYASKYGWTKFGESSSTSFVGRSTVIAGGIRSRPTIENEA